MCGITGFTHLQQHPGPERILAAVRSITHRGPDQQGVFETPSVSLGAVRLKIIDLTGGEQPMRSRDGNSVIVFNGEIYNHAELRQELQSLGHTFRSRCDTEVILEGFLEWDVRVLGRLRGMFAFGIWNEPDRRLFLARDRMGIKPLYLHERGRDLYFGSELKTLFVHDEIEREIDPAGLNYYLSLNYIPGPHTMVEGIRKLAPAHYLDWRDGATDECCYWKPNWSPREITLDSAKQELDALLRSSVKEHLVSDVPLGIWSSGGLDSSTVLHYAAEATSARLETFSVSFLGRRFDESRWFRAMAERYGTNHHEFDLNPASELESAITEMPHYSDEPSADAGALPVWFLSRMSRQHVTVALSGEGADELFGGYNTYLADGYARTARLVPDALRRLALNAAQSWPASDDKISLEFKVKRMLAGSLLPAKQAHFFWNGTFSEAQRRELLTPEAFESVPMGGAAPEELRGFLNAFIALDQGTYLPDDILCKCDRMSMAHSLEVRPPFLDHRIVELAARLPENLKIRGGSLKFVLRELMKDKLPKAILTRKKEGFDIPAHDWFRTILKPLLLDTLTEANVRRGGFLQWPVLERVMNDHFARRANYGYHLWGLLTLFLWIDRWKIKPARRKQGNSSMNMANIKPRTASRTTSVMS